MSELTKQIVEREFQELEHPPVRKFRDFILEGFSGEGSLRLSHQAVMGWRQGSPPKTDLLEDMLAVYPPSDRRFQFALRLLAAKSPHIWGFGGVVWRLHDLPRAK